MAKVDIWHYKVWRYTTGNDVDGWFSEFVRDVQIPKAWKYDDEEKAKIAELVDKEYLVSQTITWEER